MNNCQPRRAEELASRPAWLCPQASCPRAQAQGKHSQRTRLTPHFHDGLYIPPSAKRIIIFSNVPSFDVARAALRAGDHCLHINTARHYAAARLVAGTTHSLLVRRGREPRTKAYRWHMPQETTGYTQILCLMDAPMRALRPWWRDYCKKTQKSPTSGFIAYHLTREAAPDLPLLLCGFAPGQPHGTPLWRGHAWSYEALYYTRHHIPLLLP